MTTLAPFTLTVTGEWTADEIPPRCRKPRPVTHEAHTTVDIPRVDAQHFPVAFRHRSVGGTVETRVHDGNLYRCKTDADRSPVEAGGTYFPTQNSHFTYRDGVDSQEGWEQDVRQTYGAYVVFDDQVWMRCAEPFYYVSPPSFGNGYHYVGVTDTGRAPVRPDLCFRADDFQGALDLARELSPGSGNPEPGVHEKIEVLIGEQVTLWAPQREPDVVREARDDLGDAAKVLSRPYCASEEELQDAARRVARAAASLRRAKAPLREPDEEPYEQR